jgi:hypothetical protein
MITFLFLLVQTELSRVPLPSTSPARIEASRTGRFLALLGGKDIVVLDGRSLATLTRIQADATALGFDAKDETLWIVGAEVARFDTAEWKERARGALPDAGLLSAPRPGQALVTPEGVVYYRSEKGLARAREEGGAWTSETFAVPFDETSRIHGPIAVSGPTVLLSFGGHGGVASGGKAYGLAASEAPLGFSFLEGRIAFVGRKGEAFYHPTTFKATWHREGLNTAAAFEPKRGRVYAAGTEGIRSWTAAAPETVREGPRGRFTGLAVDGASERLYAEDGRTLRAWTLAD